MQPLVASWEGILTTDRTKNRMKGTYRIANTNTRPPLPLKPFNGKRLAKDRAPTPSKQAAVPRGTDIILAGKDGVAYSLDDIFQMLEIDLIMGRKKDFHKRLIRTIRAVAKPALEASTFKGKRFEPPRALNDP